MRRISVVGQCRLAARCYSSGLRSSTCIPRLAGRYDCAPYGARDFSYSAPLASKPKGSLGQIPLKAGVDPAALFDPSDASRKLFSEFAFAFEYVLLKI